MDPGAVLMSSITVLVTTLFGAFPGCPPAILAHLGLQDREMWCASVFNFQISPGTFLPQQNRA